MTTTTSEAASGGESTTTTAPAAGEAATTTTDAGEQGSLLTQQGATAATTGEGDDWLPEKFRVNAEDGKLDEAASARKLAESYKALEAHKGELPQVPATPEDYKLEAPKDAEGKPIAGLDMDAFVTDPMFQAMAKDAHAKGVTNEHMQFFVEKYLDAVPKLMAAEQSLSVEDAKAELAELWPDDKTMNDNLAISLKAINGYGAEAEDVPGSKARIMAKYGRDPDFIAFAAAIGAEMKEDTTPAQMSVSSGVDVEAMMKSEAYMKPSHPDHERVKARVKAHFDRTYGTKRR